MGATLERIKYPAVQAVTDDEVKGYLLVKSIPDAFGADLTEQIKEAIDEVEGLTRRSLMSATFRLSLDCWPDDCVIALDRYPVVDIISLKYRDTDGTWTPMVKDTDYVLDKNSKPGRVLMLETPSLSSDHLSKVEIIFHAGASNASQVPLRAKRAIKLLVASSFGERTNHITGIRKTRAEQLCRTIAIKRL